MKLIPHCGSSTRYSNRFLLLYVFFLAGYVCNAQSSVATAWASGGDNPYAISVTSQLVVVPVNVTDDKGSFVSGLTEKNFSLYEGKQLQNLTLFQQEDAPVSVGLIVDHSASMKSTLPNVITAISAFAHSGNAKDEMFVVDFNDDVTVEPMGGKLFTNDPADLEKAVDATSARGRTALYDAVAEGLLRLQRGQWPRKALVIVSDGGDNASGYTYSRILELARQSQVTIYSVVLLDQSVKQQNPRMLRRLSADTGGMAFLPNSRQSVIDFCEQIARDLREQYVLGFVPDNHTNGTTFRKIQVRVSAPDGAKLHVRARPGYSPSRTKTAALTSIQALER